MHRGGGKLEPSEATTSGAEGLGNLQTIFKIFCNWGQPKTVTFLWSGGSLTSPIANKNNSKKTKNKNNNQNNDNKHNNKYNIDNSKNNKKNSKKKTNKIIIKNFIELPGPLPIL